MTSPIHLRLYRLATALAEPFAPWLLGRRAGRGKEDAARLGERLGRAGLDRPDGRLVWIHGASVGESLSHLPLVERLVKERPDLSVLVTSGTRTSAELLARRLPPGVMHQYAPIDGPGAVRRFLEHWRPDTAIFIESELWPNLLQAAHDQGARLALLSARVGVGSARSWEKAPAAAGAVLGLFDLIYAQDGETQDWIESLGVAVAGRLDLKRAAGPLPCDEVELGALRQAIGGRRVVTAASTHTGEETLITEIAQALEPRPFLILAPRHRERGAMAEVALGARGWSVARRSRGQPITAETEAYVADTIGELGLFYRLADVVVMGGSFFEGMTGHNPLEPARLGKAVISGANIDAFADVYAEMVADKAVLIARGEEELARGLKALLAEPALARALGERGKAIGERGREAFDEAWITLQLLLPAAP